MQPNRSRRPERWYETRFYPTRHRESGENDDASRNICHNSERYCHPLYQRPRRNGRAGFLL